MKSKKVDATSIDEYIANFPEETQQVLKEVRVTIKAASQDIEEKISYGMPTFTLNGQKLMYFAGWKNYISIYPTPTGNDAFNKSLQPYMDHKSTLKFPLDKPWPLKLIGRIAKFHITNNLKSIKTK